MSRMKLENISKIFPARKQAVQALDHINLELAEKEFTLIQGPSGCGKSTLLFILGGMMKPSDGEVLIGAENLYHMSERKRRAFCAQNLGFVFQSYHLIPYLNIRENIEIQQRNKLITQDKTWVKSLIDQLELGPRLEHRPAELSAGEKQRVALIRALGHRPDILLADEPTGNLDPENQAIVFQQFKQYQAAGGTVIMVSHSPEANSYADRTVHIRNGQLESN